MSVTYGTLQAEVSAGLSDPGNDIFNADLVKDFIQDAMAEIGDIAPEFFTEDITPVADTLSYVLRSDDFDDEPQPQIELLSVEVWDGSVTPNKAFRFVEPAAGHPTGLTYSQAGWFCWNGTLYLPNRVVDLIDPDVHFVRVRGYSPYPVVEEDDDVINISNGIKQALLQYTRMRGYDSLITNRVLYTQWQARANNSDISPAALMNEYNIAADAWRRRSKRIMVIRESP